jgi:hypothetical protein
MLGFGQSKMDSIESDLRQRYVPTKYILRHDWCVFSNCFRNKININIIDCTTDSVLLYTPIPTNDNPSDLDTTQIMIYSGALFEFKEPKLYNSKINNVILRLTILDSIPILYRIEKGSNIYIIRKIAYGDYHNIDSIKTQDTTVITQKELNKLENLINNSKLRITNTSFQSYYRAILIENFIDKKYFYNYSDLLEFPYYQDRVAVLKCFKYLVKLTKK